MKLLFHHLSNKYGLVYGLIGGQNMPMEAFWAELEGTNNWGFATILEKKPVHANDGTTRLLLTVK